MAKGMSLDSVDGGYGWIIVLASFFMSVVNDGIMYTLGEFITDIDDDLKGGKGYTSSIVTVMEFTCYMMGPIANGLTHVYGCRAVTVAGSALAGLGLLIGSVSNSVPLLILGVGIFTGAGYGLIYLAQIVILTEYFTSRLGAAIGISVCGTGLGMMTFGPLIGHLIDAVGWHQTLYILGLVSASSVIAALLLRPGPLRDLSGTELPPQPIPPPPQPATTSLPPQPHPPAQISDPVETRCHVTRPVQTTWSRLCRATKESFNFSLLKSAPFVVYGFGCFFNNLGYYVPTTFMSERAVDLGVANQLSASYLFIYLGIGNIISRSLAGIATLWLSPPTRFVTFNLAIAAYGGAIVLSGFCTTYWSLILYALIVGLTEGILITLSSVIMVDLFGVEKMASAFGITSLFNGFGALIGPVIVGYLKDWSGSYDLGYQAAGGFVLFNAALYCLMPVWFRDSFRARDTVIGHKAAAVAKATSRKNSSASTSENSEKHRETEMNEKEAEIEIEKDLTIREKMSIEV